MNRDNIIEVGIDDGGRLIVKPEVMKFDYIYRSAAEVHWNKELCYLYSPQNISLLLKEVI